jgi:biopolymer transport protein ExbB/TolQ
MNSFELLEAVFVGIIIVLQAYNFYQTNRRIAVYRHIFPEEGSFEVFAVSLSKEALKLHPRELLGRLNEWALGGDEVIDLIRRKGGGNEVTDKIVYSLNTYLLRNKGVASDFHLIKDIVERNCDSVEEDVHQTISLPLYLGLLGTFVGIVVGLVKISGIDFAGENNGMDLAISALLKGVMIAMIASFFGLMLTVLNNGFFFKGAKAQLEQRKNDFYTFVQTELLPLLNQNINSTLYSLQTNLFRFNEEFKDNIGMLREVMGKNHDALVAQEKILNTLENIDITEFGKANVDPAAAEYLHGEAGAVQ